MDSLRASQRAVLGKHGNHNKLALVVFLFPSQKDSLRASQRAILGKLGNHNKLALVVFLGQSQKLCVNWKKIEFTI
jgi:hypothetical protein